MGGELLLKGLNRVSAWNKNPSLYEVSMGNSVKVISQDASCEVLTQCTHMEFLNWAYTRCSHMLCSHSTLPRHSVVLSCKRVTQCFHAVFLYCVLLGAPTCHLSALILCSHTAPRSCCFVMLAHGVCSDALLSICSALIFKIDILI